MVIREALAVLAALVTLVPTAGAQPTPAVREPMPLELKRERAPTPRRPIERPAAERDQAVREAERAAGEYERAQREDALVREQSRPAPRRPDLGYDVYGGIQQRSIPRR